MCFWITYHSWYLTLGVFYADPFTRVIRDSRRFHVSWLGNDPSGFHPRRSWYKKGGHDSQCSIKVFWFVSIRGKWRFHNVVCELPWVALFHVNGGLILRAPTTKYSRSLQVSSFSVCIKLAKDWTSAEVAGPVHVNVRNGWPVHMKWHGLRKKYEIVCDALT